MLGSLVPAHAAAIKIMPLGDSITHGFTNANSYRRNLWKLLTNGGYNVDFVGSQTTGYDGPVPNPDFDLNHEGHGGYQTSQIRDNINAWATAAQPDVVMLHIGTNDSLNHNSVANTTNYMAQIINSLRAINPNIKILIAQIIPIDYYSTTYTITDTTVWPYLTALNQAIPILAAAKTTGPSPVVVVDQFSDFNFTDLYDGLHPNPSGEAKMASRWFDALQGMLTSTGNPQPKITLTQPADASGLVSGGNLLLQATATDGNGSVTNVEFFAGTTRIGGTNNAPYQFIWTNVAAGVYDITARALDNNGAARTSFLHTVTVAPGSRWSMENGSGTTASDNLGTNLATLRNGVTWTNGGRIGGGVSLDGVNDHLDAPSAPELQLTRHDFTVAIWVKTTKSSAQCLVEKQSTNFVGIFLLAINRDNVVPGKLSVYNGANWIDSIGGGLANGQWHHVAVTYDRISYRLYIDGVLDSTVASYDFLRSAPQPWTFGRFSTLNVGWEFGGLMDEVRICQRTLSASEIAGLVAPPSGQTLAASGVTSTAATLNGSVSTNLNPVTAYFQWGATVAYGSLTGTQNFPGAGTNTPYTVPLTGLPPGTTWHFRAVVTNSLGVTPGADQFFTTLPGLPGVITLTASNVATSNATLRGTVTANAAATGAYFQYGTTTNYGTTSAWQNFGAGISNAPLDQPVSGLLPGTLYHFRIAGTNSAGTNYGGDLTFSTTPAPNQPPVVSAGTNQDIFLPAVASLSGSVTDDGLPSNSVSVTWSRVSGPGSVTFGNSNAPVTTASFSTNGVYQLMLAASDGALSTNAQITVTVRVPLRFSGPFRGSNGSFGFRLTGPSGSNYFTEYASALTNWLPLATNSAPLGVVDIIDPGAANRPSRIYRARLFP